MSSMRNLGNSHLWCIGDLRGREEERLRACGGYCELILGFQAANWASSRASILRCGARCDSIAILKAERFAFQALDTWGHAATQVFVAVRAAANYCFRRLSLDPLRLKADDGPKPLRVDLEKQISRTGVGFAACCTGAPAQGRSEIVTC